MKTKAKKPVRKPTVKSASHHKKHNKNAANKTNSSNKPMSLQKGKTYIAQQASGIKKRILRGAQSRPPGSWASYRVAAHPAEVVVGQPVTVSLVAPTSRGAYRDWVGIYPVGVPSVPGVSQGRWLYVPRPRYLAGATNEDSSSTAPAPVMPQVPKKKKSKSHNNHATPAAAAAAAPVQDFETVEVTFPSEKLPPHAGKFEIRVHAVDRVQLYRVVATSRITLLRAPASRAKRICFLALLGLLIVVFQLALDSKGSCPTLPDEVLRVRSELLTDAINDKLVALTAPINAYLHSHPPVASAAQAVSSAVIDATFLSLFVIGALCRSTVRPFLSVFVLMLLRFVAQLLATFPCPADFMWPRGQMFGFNVPTLFVDYHPTNDFFFSGHVGSLVVAAIQFAMMDYWWLALFECIAVVPVMLLVVSFRVHRGIDVFTATIAAITACTLVEQMVDPIDEILARVEGRQQHALIKQKYKEKAQ
ncbi:hypothetical protein Pelo_3155 [Pelomyxa schiedti]|nr:hypothetical protein Pelo_3155 [Pelomyxa schiedti]